MHAFRAVPLPLNELPAFQALANLNDRCYSVRLAGASLVVTWAAAARSAASDGPGASARPTAGRRKPIRSPVAAEPMFWVAGGLYARPPPSGYHRVAGQSREDRYDIVAG